MNEQQLLAQHIVKIIRAEIEHLPYPGSPIALSPDNLEALANEYDQSIPRATVADALAELQARIAAESVSLTPENAAGYSRDIADAENATVELVLQHVDATIAKLGLGEM